MGECQDLGFDDGEYLVYCFKNLDVQEFKKFLKIVDELYDLKFRIYEKFKEAEEKVYSEMAVEDKIREIIK